MHSFKLFRNFTTTLSGLSGPLKSVPEIYPAINFLTKELVTYPPQYGNHAKKCLQVQTPKKHNIYYTKLEEFLNQQKEDNKTHLAVPKEIIFLGRSNVGKSSLLNAIFNKKIGNVSKTPGTTKTLIFHEIYGGKAFVVDGPGYGFAKMNLKLRKAWLKLLKTYLSQSTRISRVYLLINMDHGMKTTDFDFLEFVNHYNHCIQVVLTKCDKVKEDELLDRAVAIGHQIKHFNMVAPVVHLCSSENKFGIEMIKHSIASSVLDFHSKFDLEHIKHKLRLEKLQTSNDQSQLPGQTLPPPEEMYKLLIKQGSKPS